MTTKMKSRLTWRKGVHAFSKYRRTKNMVDNTDERIKKAKQTVKQAADTAVVIGQGIGDAAKEVYHHPVVQTGVGAVTGAFKGLGHSLKRSLDKQRQQLELRAAAGDEKAQSTLDFANKVTSGYHTAVDATKNLIGRFNPAVQANEVIPSYKTLITIVQQETTTLGTKEQRRTFNGESIYVKKSQVKAGFMSKTPNVGYLEVTLEKANTAENTNYSTSLQTNFTPLQPVPLGYILGELVKATGVIFQSTKQSDEYSLSESIAIAAPAQQNGSQQADPIQYNVRVAYKDGQLSIDYEPVSIGPTLSIKTAPISIDAVVEQ
jgi:hypothetical protein